MPAVRLTLEPPQQQRRATVAFRLILAVPHLLLVGVLGMVAVVVIFLAWFAALFTATVPDGMHRFLANVLEYQARVYAYTSLLTDRYPTFDVSPGVEYDVELEIDQPDRFNRAAVFFRFPLMLWAHFLTQVVTAGIFMILFFLWLVTLVAGRMPTSGHLAVAASLRYHLRTYAYSGLLTTEYPHGFFGDKASSATGTPFVGATPTFDGDDLATLPSSPRITSLVLTTGAKVLLAIAVVIGLGLQAINVATLSFDSTEELSDIDDDLTDAFDAWQVDGRQCTITGIPGCDATVDARFHRAVQQALEALFDVEVRESAVDEGEQVVTELFEVDALLSQLSETSDPTEQLRLRFLIEDAMHRYDEAMSDLFRASVFG